MLWRIDGLGEGFSAAVVAHGMVYVTGMGPESKTGAITALSLAGERRWTAEYGPEWNGTHPGTRYPPTVDGDQLFLLSGHGVIHAFNAKTGTPHWKRDIATDFGGDAPAMGFAESLLVDGDMVYCTPGGPDASVVALNRHSGKTVWTSVGHSDQSAYCAPQIIERGGRRLLVTLTNATLIALDPATGAIIWQEPFDETEELQNHSIAPVYHEGLLYVTSGHRKGGVRYRLSDDGTSITEVWRDAVLNPLHGGVVLVDGYLYGANARGRWVCLDVEDGSLQWEDRGVGKGSVTYADGHLYCFGEKGHLALVAATADGYMEHGRIRVEGGKGPFWAHPSISDGRLYIRHGDMLTVYDIRGQ